jgi:hypothetical protein
MKPTLLILLALLCLSRAGYTQEIKPDTLLQDHYKNIVSVSIGAFPIYGIVTANYERMILNYSEKRNYSLWVRGGAGYWVWWEDSGLDYLATLGILTGRNKSHFEGSLGVVYASWFDSGSRTFLPSGTLGYRYQKPGVPLILRVGGGWPEAAYVGVGYCF